MEVLEDKVKLIPYKIKQKDKEMENKEEIIRKSEDQFRRFNLPLIEVPQKENRQNKEKIIFKETIQENLEL